MFDEFKDITGFDIEDYFRRFVYFINNQSQNIIDYYSGFLDTMDRDSFAAYENFLLEAEEVINLFNLNNERLNTVDYWTLMEWADDLKIKLETIGNFSKFARSSVKKESFSTDVSIDVSTNDRETIEELVDRLGSTDRDSDWAQIAIDNRLEQEDYNRDGGVVLSTTFKNNTKFFIQGVIDNPEGDKIKGLDINKKINFVDDDLEVLDYDATALQSLNILINLRKNDNPEFPRYGIDPSLIIGMNLKTVALPSVTRQLFQTISTDDLVEKVQVIRTEVGVDSMNMDLNIIIKSGEEQKRVLSI